MDIPGDLDPIRIECCETGFFVSDATNANDYDNTADNNSICDTAIGNNISDAACGDNFGNTAIGNDTNEEQGWIMGTNYYAHIDACPHCGHSDNVIHLGKMSNGWRFAVEVTDQAFRKGLSEKEYYHDWESFKSFVKQMNVTVRDRSGILYSPEFLIEQAESRWNLQSHDSIDDPGRHIRRDGPVDLCFYEFT